MTQDKDVRNGEMKPPKMTPAQIGQVVDGPKADTIRIKVTDREPHVGRVMGGHNITARSTSSVTIAAERAAAKYFGDREFTMTEDSRAGIKWDQPHWFTAVGLKQLHQAQDRAWLPRLIKLLNKKKETNE
jgi:hypothetical protein